MERNPYKIILGPVITEKATELEKQNIYTFKVAKDATKKDIMWAIKEIYGFQPVKCNIVNVKPKKKRRIWQRIEGRTTGWKKAYVKLKSGDKIKVR